MPVSSKLLYEFGPFRVDPEKQLLLRDGQPVPVTPKTLETLLILVRHNREVVSKDDLMKELWPDSFVEESNLSQNIFMLRKALGDTREDKRYIVTLPGKGYRFVAEVRTVTQEGDDVVIASRSRAQMVVQHQASASASVLPSLPGGATARGLGWKLWAAVGTGVVLLAISVLVIAKKRPPAVLTEKDSVTLAEFTNTTGDPVFDGALRQGLALQLEQSPFLRIISDDKVRSTLKQMGRPIDEPLNDQLAREVCERNQSKVYISGSIATLGSQYVLGLKAVNCLTGEVVAEEQAQASRKEDVLKSLSEQSSLLRGKLKESLASIQKFDIPLEQATTPSLDALRAYSLGMQAMVTTGEKGAIPFFQRAVEIDPGFAAAYAYLALEYGSSGSSELATENIRKAYELRDRASDKERFLISAYYFGRGTGNQEKARQICEEWSRTYPREPTPHYFLTGFIYPTLANYNAAIEEGHKAIELSPESAVGYMLLGGDLLYSGRLSESQEVLRRATERNLENFKLIIFEFDLGFAQGNADGMQRAVSAAQGNPDWMDWLLDRQAFVMAHAGQLRKARTLSAQSVELAQQQGDRERAAAFRTRLALWEAFFGNLPQAKQDAASALALARNREVNYGAAVALAMAGDEQRAIAVADELEKNFPEDTSVRFNYLPTIRGIVAIKAGEPVKAIELLDSATPYELGSPRSALVWFFGSLYPVLVRGDAYLAAHKPADAAREYEKILSHRDLMTGDPLSALVEYRLARAYASAGEPTQARVQYEKFLSLWKDADPDLTIYKQAKVEYAKLQ